MNQELILLLLIFIPVFLVIFLEYRLKRIVLKTSEKIKSLQKINAKTQFNSEIKKILDLNDHFNSLARLNSVNFDDYFVTLIEKNEAIILEEINKVEDNNKTFKNYIKEVEALTTNFNKNLSNKLKVNINRLLQKEEKMFKKLILSPVLELKINVILRYISPKKRRSYYRTNSYNYFELKQFYQELLAIRKTKESRDYQMKLERSKMSASLRYQVLIRDDKTCQICGSNSKNGAILHVDHIVPVAKGGKSTLNNLRTLCDRCNLGKKDKIEDTR